MVRVIRRCLFAIGPGLGLFGVLLIVFPELRWRLSDEGWGTALTIIGFFVAFIIIAFAEYEEVSGQAEPEINGLDAWLWIGGVVLALMFVGLSFVAASA